MSMFNVYILVAFVLFAAFFIGLNLGIHGNVSRLETSLMNDIRYLESKVIDVNPDTNAIKNDVTSSANTTPVVSISSTLSSSTSITSGKTAGDSVIGTTLSQSQVPLSPLPPPPSSSSSSSSSSSTSSLASAVEINKISPSIYKIKSKTAGRKIVHENVASVTGTPTYSSVKSGELSTLRKAVSSQPIGSYITANSIPILLMTCNRPDLLRGTLKSLLAVRGVRKEDILVAQDGNMREVTEIVKNVFKLDLIQNTEGLNLRGGYRDGAERIARHYKFSLSHAFSKFANAAAMIVVEDDLLFSPDFYEYFNSVAPILDIDKSLFVISAWNDNGFKGKVEDNFALQRTEFFPGLGWLLPRALYKGELEAIWPTQHWDHWLRSYEIHRGREILYPEVPRTFHNGIKGTFMDLNTHNRYFKDIDYNTDASISWLDVSAVGAGNGRVSSRDDVWGNALQLSYEKRIVDLISSCHHASSIEDLEHSKGVVCLWIHAHPDENEDFNLISAYFRIWHEHKRGSHKGLHSFYWGDDKYVLLLNVHAYYKRAYGELKPPAAKVFSNHHFSRY